jgi:hypothetical protein
MLSIPLTSVPSQTLNAVLGGQNCTLNVYTLSTGLFIDVIVNGAPILSGALCLNQVRVIRDKYLGFIGDLAFFDTQGVNDPDYTGLGGRYVLLYLEASDL